jgi:perosamine synthetase
VIPLTNPYVDEFEANAAAEVIASGWLTQGPRVAEFERVMADYCGTAHSVAVANCTTALHLSLLALDIGPGDEVICPSMSFIATANAICHAGATPVFADIDPVTYNLAPAAAEQAITSRTKAILVVHQLGMPADMDCFSDIAKRRGVKIVEDAACAIGSLYKGRPVGGQGEMACFSFHPRKVLTTGEGGMITTNSSRHAERLRLLRQHGMSVPDTARHAARTVILEHYLCVGYNYRLTDLQAAVGIEQMKKLPRIVELRTRLAARYTDAFHGHPWLLPPHVPSYATPNFQSYAVRLRCPGIDRNKLMQRLLDRGIATRRGVMLAHREPAYVGHTQPNDLSVSEAASAESLLIPIYPGMTDAEQQEVIDALSARAAAA